MMLRSAHLPLGFVVSPLLRCNTRLCSLVSLPAIAPLSQTDSAAVCPQKLLLCTPCTRSRGVFGAFRMSSGGRDSSPDVGAAPRPAVAPPAFLKPKICFCHSCGNPTKQVVPEGEEKIRAVCTACGKIHYENPKMPLSQRGLRKDYANKIKQIFLLKQARPLLKQGSVTVETDEAALLKT